MAASTAKTTLGQFFTPPTVVDFVLDALAALGVSGRLRLIDPACGDGAFLRAALQRLPGAEAWGCDIDPTLRARWSEAGLAGGRAHLVVQDGLADAPNHGIVEDSFDVALGNPPYGFAVPRPEGRERIEELFLRRFCALARDGGSVAIVIPEGILANARSGGLRDGLLGTLAVAAVVALPERTFSRTGTTARTAILIGRKSPQAPTDVLLASPSRGNPQLGPYLAAVLAELAGRASRWRRA